VAVGDAGTILTSSNGMSWSRSTWGTADLEGVTYGGGRFVAVSSSFAILTSDDGLAWSPRSVPIPTFATFGWLSDVAYGSGRFVVIGGVFVPSNFFPRYPIAYASVDGLTWSPLSDLQAELRK